MKDIKNKTITNTKYIITEDQLQAILENKIYSLLEQELSNKDKSVNSSSISGDKIATRLAKDELMHMIDDNTYIGTVGQVIKSTPIPDRKQIIQLTQEQFRTLVLKVTLKKNSVQHGNHVYQDAPYRG